MSTDLGHTMGCSHSPNSSSTATAIASPISFRSRSRASSTSPTRSSSQTTLHSPNSESEFDPYIDSGHGRASGRSIHPKFTPLSKIDEKLNYLNEKHILLKPKLKINVGHHITQRRENDGRPLLTFHEAYELMPWQMDNPNIHTGYRRPTASFRGCIWSIAGYLHNETVNILTHLIGALMFFSLIPLHLLPKMFPWANPTHHQEIDFYPTPHTVQDTIALCVQLGAIVLCFGLSSAFHTLSCHSRRVSECSHRGDYIGIVVLIVGSVTPTMYYAFHGQPFWQSFYILSMLTSGVISGRIVVAPHRRANRWNRTLTFAGLGASAFVPAVHIFCTQGLAHARSVMSLDLVIMAGTVYLFGALIYAARIPESLSPGSFDYFFSSHQIFHVLVVVGAALQYAALRGMIFGRAMAVGQAMAGADQAAMVVADVMGSTAEGGGGGWAAGVYALIKLKRAVG